MSRTIAAALLALAPAAVASAQATQPSYATAPALPGSWGYRAIAGGSEAAFVDTAGIRRLVVQCTRANRVLSLSMTSVAPAQSLVVWTSSGSRALPANYDQRSFQVVAAVAAQDPLLDAIAFSRGRFALSIPGSPAVVLQPQPEFERTIEDCRI